MTFTIKGDTELYRRLDSLSDVMKRTFWTGVQEDLEDNLLANIKPHSKTGKLERNAYVDVIDNGVEAGVRDSGMLVSWRGAKVNYGIFLEYGTRKHSVAPKNKKALRWNALGGFAFSKGHEVSGIKAEHYLSNAAKETFSSLNRIFTAELHKKGIT